MKIAIMGVVIAATVISALPASAEVVVRAGENGVAIGERHHDNWRHRDWRHHRAECRTIRSRTVTPSGRVIIRTRSTC
jgi:hypothetical protein